MELKIGNYTVNSVDEAIKTRAAMLGWLETHGTDVQKAKHAEGFLPDHGFLTLIEKWLFSDCQKTGLVSETSHTRDAGEYHILSDQDYLKYCDLKKQVSGTVTLLPLKVSQYGQDVVEIRKKFGALEFIRLYAIV